MSNQNIQFDTLLERLINGESIEALSREFPAYATELSSYGKIKEDLSKVASMRPSEEGLRRALSSMRALDARREAESGALLRISAFFVTYRTALVLPVLVIMLVATGAVALPLSMDPEPTLTGGDLAADAESTAAEYASLSQHGAPAQSDAGTMTSAPMYLKSAQMSTPEESMPQDQDLASVFGSEMRSDSQEAAAAQSAAAEEANDSADVAGYENTYDASDF